MAKSFPVQTVEAVLDGFAEQGLQSDRRFAECYTRARINKGYGHRRILEDLKQRGINREDFPDCADQDWDESLLRVYIKKYGNTRPTSPSERARREHFMLTRGFTGDQIRHLLRHLIHSDDANDS